MRRALSLPRLWNGGYDLLCPYCNNEFSQEEGLANMKEFPQHSSAHAGRRPA